MARWFAEHSLVRQYNQYLRSDFEISAAFGNSTTHSGERSAATSGRSERALQRSAPRLTCVIGPGDGAPRD